ncbi:antitoxin VbhA family protein [Rhodococcus sp. MSC1_016]|uniref:antitoxin VbhA family protein n=1 Tax=Rhodococcus sp. MSC1_016 TaxID=2909266 RepID=UPI0035AFBC47
MAGVVRAAPQDPAARRALAQSSASAWHEGWTPNCENLENLTDRARGAIDRAEYRQRLMPPGVRRPQLPGRDGRQVWGLAFLSAFRSPHAAHLFNQGDPRFSLWRSAELRRSTLQAAGLKDRSPSEFREPVMEILPTSLTSCCNSPRSCPAVAIMNIATNRSSRQLLSGRRAGQVMHQNARRPGEGPRRRPTGSGRVGAIRSTSSTSPPPSSPTLARLESLRRSRSPR